MTICRHFPLAALMSACLLPAPPLAAEERQPTPPAANAQADADLQDARNRLASQIDKSIEANAYADLVSTLVASNPLGIDVTAPDAALRAQLGLIEGQGVVVTAVPEGSQGAQAGVKVHDVLLAIDGQGVGDAAALHKLLEASGGKEVNLMLRRGGKSVELKTTLQKQQLARLALDNWLTADLAKLELIHADRYRIGVTLSEADDTLRAQVGLAAGEGLVVTEVLEGTPAAEGRIRVHDVLTMLDGKRLTTVDAINAQIQEIKDKPVELRLLRGGKEMTLRIAPRKTQEAAFADKPVRVWHTESCNSCHDSSHQLANPHSLMGWKLGADTSVRTDGHHTQLFLYGATKPAAGATPTAPERQIEALRAQLTEMQKTLEALQASLPQPAKPEAREEGKRD
jgi:predicted metalloprotease with PDZ domain